MSYIAFIRRPHPTLLSELEHQLLSSSDYLDPLLLAYSALAAETTTANEQRIVSFLLSQLEQAPSSDAVLVHYIHALGNTGSQYALDTIVSYINYTSLQVQLVSIGSLRKLINNPVVEDLFYAMLQTTPVSFEHVVTIAETLIDGYTYHDGGNYMPPVSLQEALVTAALQFGDVELSELVLTFLENIDSSDSGSLAETLEQALAAGEDISIQTRGRRGTDWDMSNSDNDIAASHCSHVADVRNYPLHNAYVYSKKLGIDKANVKFDAGFFTGISSNCSDIKLFGKAAAKARILKWSLDIGRGEVLLEKRNDHLHAKVYFKFLNNVLTDYNYEQTFNDCYKPSEIMYSSPRYSLGSFSYSVFVYATTLTLYIRPLIQIRYSSSSEVCTNNKTLLHVYKEFNQHISFTVEGAVTADLLVRSMFIMK